MNPRIKHILVLAGAVLGIAVLVLAGFAGVAWYRIRQDLSQAPPRSSTALVPNTPVSTVALPVKLPFDGLASKLEAAAPKSFTGSGNGPQACAGTPKVCTGTHYDFRATRGPMTVTEPSAAETAQGGSQGGGSLRVTVPITISGHAGLVAQAGKAAPVPPKSFFASTQAVLAVSFGMGPDWCPRLNVSTDMRNLSAQVQVSGDGSPIDLAPYIKEGAQKSLTQLNQAAAAALKCADVQKTVQALWEPRSFPLPVLGDAKALYVNVNPVSLGFSGLQLTQAAVSFMMSLGVQVSVADAALPAQNRPLPPWAPVALAPGGVHLAIPLRLSYGGLDAHLLALLAAHPLDLATPRGPGKIAVDKLNIYPSGDLLAVGAHVQAKMPDSFFDDGGWVYWTARPQLVDGKAVQLAGIGYSKLGSNPLTQSFIDLVDGQMHSGLAAAGQFDLTQSLAKGVAAVKSGLSQSKLSFDLSNATIKVGRVVLGTDALYVEAVFNAGAADAAPPPSPPAT